jgi:hypothetical protein
MAEPGRPTVMTEDVLAKLRQAFLMGCDDEEACAFAEIDPKTLYRYQEKNHEYASEKAKWKQNPILKAKATIYSNLNEKETAKWYLERKKKGEFAQRNEMTGADGKALSVTWKDESTDRLPPPTPPEKSS